MGVEFIIGVGQLFSCFSRLELGILEGSQTVLNTLQKSSRTCSLTMVL